MAIRISDNFLEAMRDHARRTFPHECCGLLIGQRSGEDAAVQRVELADNITVDDPTRNYQIDWETLLTTSRQTRSDEREIVGFFHSHTDGTASPSRKDNEHAWVDRFYVIVPIGETSTGEFMCWRRASDTTPLELVSIVSE